MLAIMMTPGRADATFHLNLIVEVYPGSYASPDAQYVTLRAQNINQNRIGGKSIVAFNADGTPGPDFGTFATDSPNRSSGANYLMATPAALTLFGLIRSDGIAAGHLPFPDGKICFIDPGIGTVVDCVAYGAYTGDNTGFGSPATALQRQRALARIFFSMTSKNNAFDFALRAPNLADSLGDTRPDGDGDGIPDVSDCAPSDSSVYLAPFEAAGLSVVRTSGASGIETDLAWDDQSLLVGPQTLYDLIKGDLASLRGPEPFAGAVCLASILPAPSFNDLMPDPGVDQAVYYLSRARNGCGFGTYGDSSLTPDPRDFLDA